MRNKTPMDQLRDRYDALKKVLEAKGSDVENLVPLPTFIDDSNAAAEQASRTKKRAVATDLIARAVKALEDSANPMDLISALALAGTAEELLSGWLLKLGPDWTPFVEDGELERAALAADSRHATFPDDPMLKEKVEATLCRAISGWQRLYGGVPNNRRVRAWCKNKHLC